MDSVGNTTNRFLILRDGEIINVNQITRIVQKNLGEYLSSHPFRVMIHLSDGSIIDMGFKTPEKSQEYILKIIPQTYDMRDAC